MKKLTAETEPGNQLAIPILVFRFQIVEQLASLVHHLQKTLPGMMIFFVLAKMAGELRNSCGQQCNLYLRRARIGIPAGIIRNYAALFFSGK